MNVAMSVGSFQGLQPLPRIWWRRFLCCGLTFGVLSSRLDWRLKSTLCVLLASVVGSFVEARIRDQRFERGWVLWFVPLPMRSWPLEQFTQIETEWVERGGLLEALLLGLYGWLISRLSDWTLLGFGGCYALWLRTAAGPRVLVWRGNHAGNFRKNLQKLQQTSGLPVRRLA
jgi:hypothetical protein